MVVRKHEATSDDVTKCPNKLLQLQVSTPNEVSSIREFNGNEQDVNMPPSFEELMQENEVITDNLHSNSCMSDLSDKLDEFSLPDARALLHVTSRRKIYHERAELLQVYIIFLVLHYLGNEILWVSFPDAYLNTKNYNMHLFFIPMS